jgi:hypothetical protein
MPHLTDDDLAALHLPPDGWAVVSADGTIYPTHGGPDGYYLDRTAAERDAALVHGSRVEPVWDITILQDVQRHFTRVDPNAWLRERVAKAKP